MPPVSIRTHFGDETARRWRDGGRSPYGEPGRRATWGSLRGALVRNSTSPGGVLQPTAPDGPRLNPSLGLQIGSEFGGSPAAFGLVLATQLGTQMVRRRCDGAADFDRTKTIPRNRNRSPRNRIHFPRDRNRFLLRNHFPRSRSSAHLAKCAVRTLLFQAGRCKSAMEKRVTALLPSEEGCAHYF